MTDAIQTMIAAYKRNVAGAYRSLAPDRIEAELSPGPSTVSEKIDGETWFLHADGECCILLSPFGKKLENIPLTTEAQKVLNGWCGLLAGELYAAVDSGRPRVFDLHAALGRKGNPDRLRFAVFDILVDGKTDTRRFPFTKRLALLQRIVDQSHASFHLARCKTAKTASDVASCYESIVTDGGAEGLVVHAADGRIFKIKPEISIDAAVVGYVGNSSGVSELLLALMKPDGVFQLIGRVKTGWSREENADLQRRVISMDYASTYRKTNDHGQLYRWVKPDLVIEIKCNDLIAVNSKNEPVRRMAMDFNEKKGWSPLAPASSVSMIHAVFRCIREDKQAVRPDVRIEQVSDLVPIAEQECVDPAFLPESKIIRREVYTKRSKKGLAVRKLVGWKTNKHEIDPAYPNFVIFFTDYAPGRKQPLKTDLRVAAREMTLHTFADDWLAANIKRGWEQVKCNKGRMTHENHHGMEKVSPSIPPSESTRHLKIAFARSTSPTFPIIRKRLNRLAKLGSLDITTDDKGRESWFELSITQGLVENARRIDNLLNIVKAWKTTEVSIDGELVGKHDLQDFMDHLEDTRRCWLKRKKQGEEVCRKACILGCDALNLWGSHEWLKYSGCDAPPWWTVGSFDGEKVEIDKSALKRQLDAERNSGVRLCPFFQRDILLSKIDALPKTVEADGESWIQLYHSDSGKPAWIWPANEKIPPTLRKTKDNPWRSGGMNISVDLGLEDERQKGNADQVTPKREIPSTKYADVVGQDDVVDAVRDRIELPLKYADIFYRIGAKPQAGGVILAGPPGTGKTLLARAVAGECDAHIESVSGPELLSKWVGDTEEALRTIFERARDLSPSVILFDEIDSLAVSRSSADAQYQKSMVTQLLALLDGLEERGKVFVIATTNRPDDIDAALRRPGRFDQVIQMGPPDERGRIAIFRHYLKPLVLTPELDRDCLATKLASLTPGLTGADIAHFCQNAARICVKEASRMESPLDNLAIRKKHFRQALHEIQRPGSTCPNVSISNRSEKHNPPKRARSSKGLFPSGVFIKDRYRTTKASANHDTDKT